MAKRIYRSRSDKVIAGVCGGLAEYFGIDRVLIRIVWVVTVICAGTGILAYIIAWILIPKEPETNPVVNSQAKL
ncbi:MAG: PspC domain-containing protein [candidate division Zixibacteria bacterium RBG_16_48_11]|nr:MAG: PspC domain-containing protein [candidate division Zixibacteria bacterium RBG_16_48_11]